METVDPVVVRVKRKALNREATADDGGPRAKIRRISHGPCDGSRLVIRNYRNFVKSRPPKRVMFFEDGEWRDFPGNVMASLVDAFRDKRSSVVVSMRNCAYLIDFVHMVLIDQKSGAQQSVAWIDEAEKCFFPLYFDGDDMPSNDNEINLKLEIQIGLDNFEPEEPNMISNAKLEEEVSSEIKEVVAENGISIPNIFEFEGLDNILVRLERGDDYNFVQKIFLTGFGAFATPNIMSIHRYVPKGCVARAKSLAFEDQIEIMNTLRGDANVRRGWHCSSKEDVVGILSHGFGRCRKPSVGVAYGTGIYFAPEHCSHVSVKFCDVDENGVQHMVLCRIIMGSMEQVQPGSEQFQPSHEDVDSGVDDIQNPRLYVVWSTHMNTHIHPEYVVSFKLIPSQLEVMAGLKEIRGNVDTAMFKDQQATSTVSPVRECKNSVPVSAHVKLPTSAWLPFSVLFGEIQKSISPSSKKSLDRDYNEFKSKKITREQFILRLRTIAGDDLLRSTLRQFQCNPPPAVQSSQQMLMHKGPLN